ncbi:MFS transporter [Aeromicrobium fastidiosum]|nr:MFS transporter [Aeromicrobium fastidiosum]MBP2390241.1 putative MFS family arabinose efflux permease [Aeromicrobium fastidiosum]
MRAVAAAALSMTMVAAPPFVVGTMGPGISADLGLSVPALAGTVSFGYLVAAVASPLGGVVVQRVGPSRALRLAAALASLGVALVAVARGPATLALAFVALGMANAVIQPASNGTLATAATGRRQGAVFGIVQSAVPAATLLAGLLLASFDDVRPWREAMVILLVATLLPQIVVPRPAAGSQRVPRRASGRSSLPHRGTLIALCAGGFMGSAAATTVAVFGVASGLSSGLSPAVAAGGLVLGSLCCITGRILTSWRWGDHAPRRLLLDIAGLQATGVLGIALVGTGTTAGYLVGIAFAFGCGWGWTGLLNIVITRVWGGRVASVTGVMQAGLFGGSVAGPLVFAAVVDGTGYLDAWLVAAAALTVAASASVVAGRLVGARHLGEQNEKGPSRVGRR